VQLRRAMIIVLAALATALPFQQGTGAAAPSRRAAQSTLLFRWAIPKKGHVGAWQARNGVLSYTGAAVGTALARYTVPAHADFAVQAMLRTTGHSDQGLTLNGFGLVVRQKASDPHASVAAGSFFNADYNLNEEDNMPELYWNNQTIGAAAFQPGSSWHLYRLAVQGDQYSLSIDGKLMVAYTIPDYPNPTTVGVFSRFYAVQVKQFEVDSIGPASGQIPFDPVPRDANLTIQDLPDTGFYFADLHHWYTVEEIDRENATTAKEENLDPALFATPGRDVGYAVSYVARSREIESLFSEVAPFDTAADARAFLTGRLALLHRQVAFLPNVSNAHDLPNPGLGDASWGYQVEYGGSGLVGRLTVIVLAQGRYALYLRLNSYATQDFAPDPAKSAALAISLARIVDTRLSAG
jgi:hypothetical protein